MPGKTPLAGPPQPADTYCTARSTPGQLNLLARDRLRVRFPPTAADCLPDMDGPQSTLCGRSVPSTAMTGYPPYLRFAIAVRIASVGRAAVYQRSGFEYISGYEKRSFEAMGSSPPHSITRRQQQLKWVNRVHSRFPDLSRVRISSPPRPGPCGANGLNASWRCRNC